MSPWNCYTHIPTIDDNPNSALDNCWHAPACPTRFAFLHAIFLIEAAATSHDGDPKYCRLSAAREIIPKEHKTSFNFL